MKGASASGLFVRKNYKLREVNWPWSVSRVQQLPQMPNGMAQNTAQNWTQPTLGGLAADLPRFLFVCALVSDLYCPGYNPRQPLAKNSNLARTAARNKIDSAKISAAVRAELSKAKSKLTKQSQPANKLSTAKSPRHEQPK